jgi:hypothetical protein
LAMCKRAEHHPWNGQASYARRWDWLFLPKLNRATPLRPTRRGEGRKLHATSALSDAPIEPPQTSNPGPPM